jgi:hypothetical protein
VKFAAANKSGTFGAFMTVSFGAKPKGTAISYISAVL